MIIDAAKNRARLSRGRSLTLKMPRQLGLTPKLDLDYNKKSFESTVFLVLIYFDIRRNHTFGAACLDRSKAMRFYIFPNWILC